MNFLLKAQKRKIRMLEETIRDATKLVDRVHHVLPLVLGNKMRPGQYAEFESLLSAAQLEVAAARGLAQAISAAVPSHLLVVVMDLSDSLHAAADEFLMHVDPELASYWRAR